MEPTSVIVVGAGGKLGRRLVARGLARGHRVTALVRYAARFSRHRVGVALPVGEWARKTGWTPGGPPSR